MHKRLFKYEVEVLFKGPIYCTFYVFVYVGTYARVLAYMYYCNILHMHMDRYVPRYINVR